MVDMPHNRDPLIVRGVKRFSPVGSTVFAGLRSLDPLLQYGILAKGLADPLLNALHVSHSPSSGPVVALGLPLKPLIVLTMVTASSIKQIYTTLYTSNEEMHPGPAVFISIFNMVFNSANSIFSLTAAASAFTPSILAAENEHGVSPLLILGTLGFIVGLAAEAVSETQRKLFKDDPKNTGKAYTGGLFGLARHINYGGYTIWRASYALASGGWIWGTFVGAFFASDFATRAVPVLDEYCSKRYGVQWTEFKKKVPYALIPGVY